MLWPLPEAVYIQWLVNKEGTKPDPLTSFWGNSVGHSSPRAQYEIIWALYWNTSHFNISFCLILLHLFYFRYRYWVHSKIIFLHAIQYSFWLLFFKILKQQHGGEYLHWRNGEAPWPVSILSLWHYLEYILWTAWWLIW